MRLAWLRPGPRSISVLAIVSAIACSREPAKPPPGGSGSAASTSHAVTIGQALRAGTIDDKTAAYLHLVAAIMPSRLPAGYAVPGPHELAAEWPLIATANLDAYPPAQRIEVRALLSPPTSNEFAAYASRDATGCWGRFDPAKLSAIQPIETKHFAIFPLLLPSQRTELETALDSRVQNTGAIPSQPTFRAYLDAVFEYYAGELRMPDPTNRSLFPQVATAGGGSRIPIYVFVCDPATVGANAYPDGYIAIDLHSGFQDPFVRRVILPHEVFHIFEFAAIGLVKSGAKLGANNLWPLEAAAVYVEDLVARDVHRWAGAKPACGAHLGCDVWFAALDRSFACPEEPFHNAFDDACAFALRDARAAGGGSYSKFVWFKFLERLPGFGPTMLRDFFAQFTAAGLDPVAMFKNNAAEHLIARFQLALLADRDGEAPAFSPEDRKLFYRPGDERSLDYDAEDSLRYTFRVEADRFRDVAGRRLVPKSNDIWSRQPRRFDARDSPLVPQGTHRWLIEIPPDAYIADHPLAPLVINIRAPEGAPVEYVLVPLDGEPGHPERHAARAHAYMSGRTLPKSIYISIGDLPTKPRFLMAVLTNLGSQPVTYEVAVSLPDRCRELCRDYYTEWIEANDCCEENIRDYEGAINRHNLSAALAQCKRQVVPAQLAGMCGAWCAPLRGFDKPYMIEDRGGDCTLTGYTEALCKGDCDMPAGFVAFAEWPKMTCSGLCLPPSKR